MDLKAAFTRSDGAAKTNRPKNDFVGYDHSFSLAGTSFASVFIVRAVFVEEILISTKDRIVANAAHRIVGSVSSKYFPNFEDDFILLRRR